MITKVKDLKKMLDKFPDEINIYIEDNIQSVHFRRLTLEKMEVKFPWLEKDHQHSIVAIKMMD